MSSLGLPAPHALCPQCLRHNGLLLIWAQALPPSIRDAAGGVGGRFHARRKDGERSARRRYHSSPNKPQNQKAIVPESLNETLELHRTLNRQYLIRKIPIERKPIPGIFRPEILHPATINTKQAPNDVTPREPRAAKRKVSSKEGKLPLRRVVSSSSNTGKHDAIIGSVARSLTHDPEVTRHPVGIHPFDPKSPFRSKPWAKREEICWAVGEGQAVQYPWMEHLPPGKEQQPDGLSQLDAEIEAFEAFIVPSAQEREVSEQVTSDIATLIANRVRTPLPFSIGSRKTGMALAHSDIDILIPIKDPERPMDGGRGPSPTRPKAKRVHLETLKKVERVLTASEEFKHVVPTRALVPIVSAVHGRTGLELQFQCGDKGSGTPASQEYMKNYQVEFPALRAIYAVLRMALETRGIFGAPKGTIGAYGLAMMIVTALKQGDGTFHRRNDFGKQLLYVLEVYADFDFKSTGIAVEPPSFFNKKASQRMSTRDTSIGREDEAEDSDDPNEAAYLRGQRLISRQSMKRDKHSKGNNICIQDPADYTNDLGRSCTGAGNVQRAFKDILEDIQQGIKKWDEKHGSLHADAETGIDIDGVKGNGSEKPILGFALGANYEDFELARDKVLYGAWFT